MANRYRLAFSLILLLSCVGAVFVTVRNWAVTGSAEVHAVPTGHQEIAWIMPATSAEAWERWVAALELLQNEQTSGFGNRKLRVDLDKAFLPLTADVPEIALYFDDAPDAKLWVRWYKLSGEHPSRSWFEKLIGRDRPPLAVIGGDSSDRALYQTRALQEVRNLWSAPAPLFFITTATAERYYPREYQTGEVPHLTWPKLMDVYPRRTFRFCFTNTRMVESVLDFVQQVPQVCAERVADPHLFAAAIAMRTPFGSLSMLSAAGYFQPYFLSTLAWADDSYSKDLGEIFLQVFADQARPATGLFNNFYNNYIDYSVGDFLEPNPREAMAVGLFLANNPRLRNQPQLLALPTGAQRARRFLRTLCRRAPQEVRNLVVVTGDAVTFDNIYRDRDLAWNIQDMPVPLVFFSHRNPVDTAAGFGHKEANGLVTSTGTQDVLLNRDIIEALVLAAFGKDRMVADADEFLERLGHTRWRKGRLRNDFVANDELPTVPFFDSVGNRRAGTGEHVVWLRPVFDGSRNLPEAVITVWRSAGAQSQSTWRTFRPPLHVQYDRPSQEESSVHGGD